MIDFDEFRNLSAEDTAVELRARHICNCCQAVTAALTEDEHLILASAGFGGGMGNTQGPCGALVGAVISAGLRTQGNGTTRWAKLIQENFKKRCGAIICRELKGIDTGKVLCPCEDCVRNAVRAYQDVFTL
ncbi:MAG: C_GCAxxG_C_C family protein [Flexilinea sp.]|nr:C_GCAxxG_C_C family protein [Flexilinea sp.]